MGSLLNFVFLNDTLVGNGDGSYGQTGPFFNYIIERGLSYSLDGNISNTAKNILPIEVINAGFSVDDIPHEVFDFVNNNNMKLLLIGLADPTSYIAHVRAKEVLQNKLKQDRVLFLDSNINLKKYDKDFGRVFTLNYFMEELTWFKADLFTSRKTELDYVSEEIQLEELNNFRNKKFLSFNRNLDRFHRFILLDTYLKQNFDDSLFSFIRPIKYFDEIETHYKEYTNVKLNNVDFYNKKLPIELDTFNCKNKHSFKTSNTFKKELFLTSCIHLVTETTFIDNELFLSEKILKPIINYQPFVVFGPNGYLVELKQYGFKTFSEVWDESYDNIEDPLERIQVLVSLITELNNKSIEELNDIYKGVKEICIHNRNLFYSLELDSLKVILGEIENEW